MLRHVRASHCSHDFIPFRKKLELVEVQWPRNSVSGFDWACVIIESGSGQRFRKPFRGASELARNENHWKFTCLRILG
jgi:hypothetical protein